MINIKMVEKMPSFVEKQDKITVHAVTGYCIGHFIGVCSEGIVLSRDNLTSILIPFSDIECIKGR